MSRTTLYPVAALLVAVLFLGTIALLMGASPLEVMGSMVRGAFGTPDQLARVLMTLVPLLLGACGLAFTFTAGLYNLGIEGQITLGAIAAMVPIRLFETTLPPVVVLMLAIVCGAIGGMLWGLLAGVLNVFGRINEIFAGLGLNFAADGLALYLVFGPWKRSGVASMSGTEPFNEALWLPTLGTTGASPAALAIALVAFGATYGIMRGTHFGLRLRAVGRNLRAAYVLGIPSVQYLLAAFAICGLFAGLAGSLQVLAVFHRLIPTISSNLGYLALLISMLAGRNILLLLPIALFFSALNIGSLQLPLSLNLESSFAGVIQGTIVLFVLLGRGLQERARPQTPPPPSSLAPPLTPPASTP